MGEIARLLLLLVVTGAGLTLLGAVAIWRNEESRRVRRGLRQVLRTTPHALLVARGRGRGVGFDFTSNTLAVAWDAGAWCLVYKVQELIGAELIVDGQVAGRVYRAEARRAVDVLSGAEKQVRLRLIFDDARYPDFDLDLWLAEDVERSKRATPQEALEEANRWLARTESLLRRQAPRGQGGVLPVSNAAQATAAAASRARAGDPPPIKSPKRKPPRPDALPFEFEDEPPEAHAPATPEADEEDAPF